MEWGQESRQHDGGLNLKMRFKIPEHKHASCCIFGALKSQIFICNSSWNIKSPLSVQTLAWLQALSSS